MELFDAFVVVLVDGEQAEHAGAELVDQEDAGAAFVFEVVAYGLEAGHLEEGF